MKDHYPKTESDEKIVQTFMKRFAEAYGIMTSM